MRLHRAIATAALAALAALLLGGCFTIRSASVTQLDVIGPVQVRTELCLRSVDAGLDGCRAPASTTPNASQHDVQQYFAYLVDTEAVAPETLSGEGVFAGVSFTRDPGFEAAVATRPGQAPRFATKWIAYRSSVIPAFTNVDGDVSGHVNAQFQPASDLNSLQVRVVTGWRWVRPATDTDPAWTAERPVVCGDPVTSGGWATKTTDQADCGDSTDSYTDGSNYWPRKNGGAPNNQFTYPMEFFPTSTASIASPLLGGAIDAGTATSLRFGISSRKGVAAASIPVSASTTIPGGTVSLDRTSLPLGEGVDVITAEVAAPAGAPTGTFEVTVAIGEGTGRRTASAPVGVTATTGGGTPQFGGNGLLTGKQTAALLRDALRKANAGKALRTKGKVTIRYAAQAGVKLKLVLRTSGKKGKTIATGTSTHLSGGRDKLTLKATKSGRKKLKAGRTWKGRMVITLSGAQSDLVNESLSLKVPRR